MEIRVKMLSAICFNLDHSKILSSVNGLKSRLCEKGLKLFFFGIIKPRGRVKKKNSQFLMPSD